MDLRPKKGSSSSGSLGERPQPGSAGVPVLPGTPLLVKIGWLEWDRGSNAYLQKKLSKEILLSGDMLSAVDIQLCFKSSGVNLFKLIHAVQRAVVLETHVETSKTTVSLITNKDSILQVSMVGGIAQHTRFYNNITSSTELVVTLKSGQLICPVQISGLNKEFSNDERLLMNEACLERLNEGTLLPEAFNVIAKYIKVQVEGKFLSALKKYFFTVAKGELLRLPEAEAKTYQNIYHVRLLASEF